VDFFLQFQWIQRNIKEFGGDPASITIYGQGAGATSVFALLISPMAKGLFHKALAMSGSAQIDLDLV
jgi:para-nitrobenzyl esterase